MNWGIWGVNHSKQDMSKLISESFDSGINSFDHADIYGGYTTEESFGDAFAETGIKREDVFLYLNVVLCTQVKNYQLKLSIMTIQRIT